ncbi:MAG: hypothetical protein GY696_06665, partial [Gammaproteobacteria bacterium]|nr:hypothetical protein [Gammaproteobacteria bacterium]
MVGPIRALFGDAGVQSPPGEQLADARKKCYLAIQLGAEGLRLFGTNPVMQRRIEPETTYLELKEAAKNHFSPWVTVYKARYDFTHRLQERDETVDDYLTVLRTLTSDCDFGDTLDERLLEQLIAGCMEKKTQRELLVNV